MNEYKPAIAHFSYDNLGNLHTALYHDDYQFTKECCRIKSEAEHNTL